MWLSGSAVDAFCVVFTEVESLLTLFILPFEASLLGPLYDRFYIGALWSQLVQTNSV